MWHFGARLSARLDLMMLQGDSSGTDMGNSGATILVAEDDDAMRSYLRDLLDFEKFRVEVSENLGGTLNLLMRNPQVSLVIADDSMVETGTIGILRSLRTHGFEIPILVLTGSSGSPGWVSQNSIGRLEWLEKPFHSSELIAAVNRLLTEP